MSIDYKKEIMSIRNRIKRIHVLIRDLQNYRKIFESPKRNVHKSRNNLKTQNGMPPRELKSCLKRSLSEYQHPPTKEAMIKTYYPSSIDMNRRNLKHCVKEQNNFGAKRQRKQHKLQQNSTNCLEKPAAGQIGNEDEVHTSTKRQKNCLRHSISGIMEMKTMQKPNSNSNTLGKPYVLPYHPAVGTATGSLSHKLKKVSIGSDTTLTEGCQYAIAEQPGGNTAEAYYCDKPIRHFRKSKRMSLRSKKVRRNSNKRIAGGKDIELPIEVPTTCEMGVQCDEFDCRNYVAIMDKFRVGPRSDRDEITLKVSHLDYVPFQSSANEVLNQIITARGAMRSTPMFIIEPQVEKKQEEIEAAGDMATNQPDVSAKPTLPEKTKQSKVRIKSGSKSKLRKTQSKCDQNLAVEVPHKNGKRQKLFAHQIRTAVIQGGSSNPLKNEILNRVIKKALKENISWTYIDNSIEKSKNLKNDNAKNYYLLQIKVGSSICIICTAETNRYFALTTRLGIILRNNNAKFESVIDNFSHCCVIEAIAPYSTSNMEDFLKLVTKDADALHTSGVDIISYDTGEISVSCQPENLAKTVRALRYMRYEILSADYGFKPIRYVVPDNRHSFYYRKLMTYLLENEDIITITDNVSNF